MKQFSMKLLSFRLLSPFLILLGFLSVYAQAGSVPYFSAPNSQEYQVAYEFVFNTEWQSLNELRKMSAKDLEEYKNQYILTTVKYLYGPLNNREIGNPQRDFSVEVNWSGAKLVNGIVQVPYVYRARWLLHDDFIASDRIVIPVPYTAAALETPGWIGCTDSETDHQTMQLYWYFWDPTRPGCDQKRGVNYEEVTVFLKTKTQNTLKTYPEYRNLFQTRGRAQILTLTFAFGYTQDVSNPQPETDSDFGMGQYQEFLKYVRNNAGSILKESPIYQKEFPGTINPQKIMGHRFIGIKSGVNIKIDVMAAADVDQMDIFSKSFAHDQDSFFGWFGHSRLGWGFESDSLAISLKNQPQYYSITRNYQIIYWAGCNSYSYYTLPFFQLKKNNQDPFGTQSLDIISNGLSSYFALNAANARIILKHLINWEKQASYQTILTELEGAAHQIGARHVLINVLGDEDNQLPN